MLGRNCHSIVAGAAHADGIIAELDRYIKKGYDLILTSHYTPEDLKKIAGTCKDADSFKAAVQKQYPTYSGQNYLDMTAVFSSPD